MRRLKVLISAYACEPHKGSEPGVGWNVAREMARYHDIWVITRENNRAVIEAALTKDPVPNLHFIYFDLPRWAAWWKTGRRGVQLYYYLWQIGIYFVAERLYRQLNFDLTHHVTFAKYWAPAFISLLPAPFIWGPVGGGESAPEAFRQGFSPQGQRYERLRETARRLSEYDPFVKRTAERSRLALATTEDTARRLEAIGAPRIEILSQVSLPGEEIATLRATPHNTDHAFRLVSIGDLLHLKGFHLGLRAFARARLDGAEYWLIGDGPERQNLEMLTRGLGIADRVKFWGKLPRAEALTQLTQCNVLVHPSLHDSGGFVVLEAMAAEVPVICLNTGGPGQLVTDETGFKIEAHSLEQALADLTRAILVLAHDEGLRHRLGSAGKQRVLCHFEWSGRAQLLNRYYGQAVDKDVPLEAP